VVVAYLYSSFAARVEPELESGQMPEVATSAGAQHLGVIRDLIDAVDKKLAHLA